MTKKNPFDVTSLWIFINCNRKSVQYVMLMKLFQMEISVQERENRGSGEGEQPVDGANSSYGANSGLWMALTAACGWC